MIPSNEAKYLICGICEVVIKILKAISTYKAESFISAKAGTQNIAPPRPSKANETPFNHRELK